MPEQAPGGIPLGLGMVMKINFLNFHVYFIVIMNNVLAVDWHATCIYMYM